MTSLIWVQKNLSIYGFTFAKNFQILDFEDGIFVVGASPCLAYFQN